ncbi:hypothetical protein F5X97DRAFT_342388 [Nemania serpens]|nr:hypothetical protein F5X97DRAFT_342388 [Nemania serpens]
MADPEFTVRYAVLRSPKWHQMDCTTMPEEVSLGQMAKRKTEYYWLPKEFAEEKSIYFMSAEHRGDMYHLRAAMELKGKKFPLVLFDVDETEKRKTKDTEDYLTRTAEKSFLVPWRRSKIHSAKRPKPEDFANHKCYLNGVRYDGKDIQGLEPKGFGESDSTDLIAKETKIRGRLPEEIPKGMFILSDRAREYLRGRFVTAFNNVWSIKPDDDTKSTILAVYRDTGCNPNGVYPELDTGTGIFTIRDIAKSMQSGDGSEIKLQVISCGLKEENKTRGIGHYWEKLPSVADIAGATDDKEATKRDVEAYFLYWASKEAKKPYFKMAVGLRSGVMDLFTFLGIPTVSIGLRNMVGEPRHGWLAGEAFKRVNIQYDKPRHPTTTYVKSNDPRGKPPFKSPYWSDGAPGTESTSFDPGSIVQRIPPRSGLTEDQKNKMRKAPLKPFMGFDRYAVEIGVRLACQTYIKWPISVATEAGAFPDVITTHCARSCYLIRDGEDKLAQMKGVDQKDILSLQSRLDDPNFSIQLSRILFNEFYWEPHIADWKKLDKGLTGLNY